MFRYGFVILALVATGCATHAPVGDYSDKYGKLRYVEQSDALKSKMVYVDNQMSITNQRRETKSQRITRLSREWRAPSERNGWAGDCSNFAAGMREMYGATIYTGRFLDGRHAIACVTDDLCSGTFKSGVFSRHIAEYAHFVEYL